MRPRAKRRGLRAQRCSTRANAEPTDRPAAQPQHATQSDEHATEAAAGPIARLEATLQAPFSRRDLLRGRFVGEGDEPGR